MKVYEVSSSAPDSLRHDIARLFMQQISIAKDDNAYQHALTAVDLTLEAPEYSRIIIAEDNNMILGLAFLNIGVSLRVGGRYLWLNELYVHNEYRNQGIGKELLLHTIHLAEAEDVRSIELETGVNNSVTKHMYNSLGFYEVISQRYGFSF